MSEIHFYCVFCGAGIDADSGREVRECPKCRRFTPVPAAPGVRPPSWGKTYPSGIFSVDIKFPCPECGERLAVDARYAGDPGICPRCSAKFQCPQLPFSTAPAAKADAPKEAGPRIHLSREEIDFLSPLESSPGRTALHAS